MCKFTYLGYDRCDEPERHYLIRREKCSAKANLKNWCAPHEQEEASTADQAGKFWVSLPCPMCAEIPVVYDQPLLEIAHSRRSVLPAPHYDAVTRKYSRLPRHHTAEDDLPADVVPPPLKTTRMQVQRAATESIITKSKASKAAESSNGEYTLPATTYVPPTRELNLPKPLPVPQPATLTPPSSRESSRSPPQIRMDGALRTTPPGDGSRRELDSIREKARAANAAAMEARPPTAERFRSGSASSASSNGTGRPSQPSRQASNASITTASSYASRAAIKTGHRPQRQASATRSPPQDSVADTLANAALRSIGIDRTGTRSTAASDSPERGRRPRRRPTGGSSSDRSDSPSVWRPTISPPVLQKDSLGLGQVDDSVEPFRQRLVPFPPNKGAATLNAVSIAKGKGLVESPPRPKTPHPQSNKPPVLRLFPNDADDEEIAAAAFERMFAAESKAQAYQVKVQAQAQADAKAQVQTQIQARVAAQSASQSDAQTAAAKKDKSLPSVPAALRRVKTGQVKTVNVPPPRPPRRQNTSDSSSSAASSFKSPPQPSSATIMKVNMGPTFSLAGVSGKSQEFEIVTGPDGTMLQEPVLGQAF
ncbi:hypothetical protein J7T55_003808 [Diaporthe amygdali]|uniref:uncharacterized protein n=1 Tax=Phomopsis amygdali TaxID=1214568 RepID=UPI0022FECC16|nr:uncharacterized protein J7T55_003808 [Diaporthe amygdali]KAJ0117394.1 hypothetical protein J7T55_003808 [Diaporthe amygdali]